MTRPEDMLLSVYKQIEILKGQIKMFEDYYFIFTSDGMKQIKDFQTMPINTCVITFRVRLPDLSDIPEDLSNRIIKINQQTAYPIHPKILSLLSDYYSMYLENDFQTKAFRIIISEYLKKKLGY